jgi:hypothetical protein
MWLIVPTHDDYIYSANEVKTFCEWNNLEYCIYGSFLVPEKVRLWLSDLDIFILSQSPDPIFPISISRAFWKVKQRISELRVPIQYNLVTLWQWKRKLLTVDSGYLKEVEKWVGREFSSVRIWDILSQNTSQRDSREDDKNMMRYFHRKIAQFWTHISSIEIILDKWYKELSNEDQKELFNFWDGFKKIVTYIGSSIRVASWKSVFHLKDRELFEEWCRIFWWETSIREVFENYTKILERIKTVADWYNFLKNWWIEEIVKIYNELFTLIFDKTSECIED